MLIRHVTAYLGGQFVPDTDVRIMHGEVQEIGSGLTKGLYESEMDLGGDYLLPGFVDVHTHAFRGHDAMDGEAAVRQMAKDLYREGVAAFLPTTMSASVDATRIAVDGIRAVKSRPDRRAAKVLGVHMEAPYLNQAKCGAQRKEFLHAPSVPEFLSMCANHPEDVRIITVAPELPGTAAFIRAVAQMGVVVSIGHTNATAEQTHEAASDGATHVTHTFNAQPPLHHRDPGVPGAAMTDDRLYAEFIGDGVHLHPDVIRLMIRAKGVEKVVAITDAMEAAGLPDGEYQLGGQAVYVRGGEARLANGTLAGSVLTMHRALWNMIHLFGVEPEKAVRMTTMTPAESIGEKVIGHLVPGTPAPLTRWSKGWQMVEILDEHSAD